MDQRIIRLYDAYTHGHMGRREFLDRLAQLTGGSAAAMAVLPLLQNDYRRQVVPADHPDLEISWAEWRAGEDPMRGYLARRRGGGRRPAVLVIHENRGLNPHIQDVTRRLALEGFLALAVDMLSPVGGTPTDEDQAREMIGRLDAASNVARLASAVKFLAEHPEGTGKVGAVGFCWGGGYVNRLAAAGTSLNAGVAYYGSQIPAEQVPAITAPLCLHYAEMDERINAGIPAYEAALKAHGKTYELYRYPGTQHAFNNDTNQARYHPEAAALAWSRTLAFLRKYLEG